MDSKYIMELEIGIDLDLIMSEEYRKGIELMIGKQGATNEELLSGYTKYICDLMTKPILEHNELALKSARIIENKSQNEDYDSPYVGESEPEAEYLDGVSDLDEPIDFNALTKNELIKTISNKCFEVISGSGVIQTVFYNDPNVPSQDILNVLENVVAIDNKVGVMFEPDLEVGEYSIGYTLMDENKVVNGKINNEDEEEEGDGK